MPAEKCIAPRESGGLRARDGGGVEGPMPPPLIVPSRTAPCALFDENNENPPLQPNSDRVAFPLMSKPDRFKEEIGWLKALGGLLIAGLISMLAWLVQNYGSVTRSGLLFVVTCSFLLTLLTIAIIARLYRCFKILEAL